MLWLTEKARLKPNLSAARATMLFLHCIALLILALPVAGFQFILAVDLPNHLAIVRVWSERLHELGYYNLRLNFTPVYKIWYLLALAVYELLPVANIWFPSAVVIAGIWVVYFLMLWTLRILTKSEQTSALHVIGACYLAMLTYSPAFGWGLMSFWFAIPFAIAAGASVLRWLHYGERQDGLRFLVLASTAQITHPLVVLFLAVFLAFAIVPVLWGRLIRDRLTRLLYLSLWPVWVLALQRVFASGGSAKLDYSVLKERNWNPFHSVELAIERYRGFREALYYRPLDITVPYQTCAVVAGVLLAAAVLCWWLVQRVRTQKLRQSSLKESEQDALRLALSAIFVTAGLLFIAYDALEVEGPGTVWYVVRAPSFAVPFFMSLLLGAVILWSKDTGRVFKFVLGSALLAICLNRALFMRVHGSQYEEEAHVYYAESLDRDHIHRQQRIPFHYNFRQYRCIFQETCSGYSRLWFNVAPETTIYPLSPPELKFKD